MNVCIRESEYIDVCVWVCECMLKRMWMYVCVCVNVWCMYVCMCAGVYVCMSVYVCACVCVYVRVLICLFVRLNVCLFPCLSCVFVFLFSFFNQWINFNHFWLFNSTLTRTLAILLAPHSSPTVIESDAKREASSTTYFSVLFGKDPVPDFTRKTMLRNGRGNDFSNGASGVGTSM